MNTALVWLRRDLRLYDHAALYHASKAAQKVVLVFIFDTDILADLPRADRRVAFIWASLHELKTTLESHGSSLIVRHGRALDLIPQLAVEFDASAVFCNRDYEPAAIARDTQVADQLQRDGRMLHSYKDQVIFECDEVLTQAGKPFSVFTPYKNAWLKRLTPFYLLAYPVRTLAFAALPVQTMINLAELGFEADSLADSPIKTGNDGAMRTWQDFQTRIAHYQDTRNFPAIKGPSYLSVHLRFGTLSIRQLASYAYHHGGAGAETWLSELIWREFYQQILWHHPQLAAGRAYKADFDTLVWPNPAGHFAAWCEARTGYPLIDAAMRQLNQTGYMHNRLRMVTAAFLVKDLHVDWRLGEAYFAQHLIDFDLAANNGGWQWSASTGCDAQPWFRIFNPITQSEKFDPDGKFIKRYVPELSALPAKYIHAPWLLTLTQQNLFNVRIGVDYPAPLVDHACARKLTLALYDLGNEGDKLERLI
ncbi:MAG: deoxyribodipyrimidine photo-lyase [Sulfuriferula sp.]|nr:deoxyribodipyrimidine photo-lyase [Sulfuriferula sp.]